MIWATKVYTHTLMPSSAQMEQSTDGVAPVEVQFGRLRDAAAAMDASLEWATYTKQQPIKVWCTGLGGGDPPSQDYDFTLACISNAPTYGATMARSMIMNASNPPSAIRWLFMSISYSLLSPPRMVSCSGVGYLDWMLQCRNWLSTEPNR